MKRIFVGAFALTLSTPLGIPLSTASAQGVYIGPGGIGVDPLPRGHDDYRDGYRSRDRYSDRDRRDFDRDDDRPRRHRHRYRDDDDQ